MLNFLVRKAGRAPGAAVVAAGDQTTGGLAVDHDDPFAEE